MVVVARHEGGITLNDYVYLLNDDGTVKEFNSKDEAIEYLEANGIDEDDIEDIKFFDSETNEEL
jgi:hypothetical protein